MGGHIGKAVSGDQTHGFLVDAVVDSLTDAEVIQGALGLTDVQADEGDVTAGSLDGGEVAAGDYVVPVGRGDVTEVELAVLEGQQLGGSISHGSEGNSLDAGFLTPVVLVGLQDDLGVLVIGLQDVGTGTGQSGDGAEAVAGLGNGLFRDDPHIVHGGQEDRVGAVQSELDGGVIKGFHLGQTQQRGGLEVVVQAALIAEHNVRGLQRLAVLELDVVTDGNGDLVTGIVDGVAGCQTRSQRSVVFNVPQGLVDLVTNVLVDQQAGVMGVQSVTDGCQGDVDVGALAFSNLLLAAAAGKQSNDHHHGDYEC